MNAASIVSVIALVIGMAIGFAGEHARCDGGTTIIKRTDRLP